MRLFANNKRFAVQGFVVKLLNVNCSAVLAQREGPRLEGRVNLTLVVMVVPLKDGKPDLRHAFSAVSKEFSSSGVAIVLDQPLGLDEVMLGFRWRGGVTWLRAKAKHLNPMGGGFFQLGFRMTEKLAIGDYPELETITL